MGLKAFEIDFSRLANEITLRYDVKYHRFLSFSNWNLFNNSNRSIPLKNILKDDYKLFSYIEDEEYKGIPTGKSFIDEDGYIIDYQPVTLENHPNRLKYSVSNNNILISSLRLAKSSALMFDNEDLSKFVFSNGFYIFRVNCNWNAKFILYILRMNKLKLILDNHIYRGIGISAYKKEDLLKIKIPVLTKILQYNIVSKIEPLEVVINQLILQIVPQQRIINEVFVKHFGFDLSNADKKKKELVHYATLEDFANEELKFDISIKYRFIFNTYIKNVSQIEWVDLGKTVEVKGGKRLPKGQDVSEDESDYKYIRVDDLSWNGDFDLSNIKYISKENHEAIKNYIAKENEILLTIVGATVGKCGLVPPELDGENITENFARLIVKNKEYLPEYVNYCLQSKTSVYQIDEYKGRGSQGKLALFRIKKIKIPRIAIDLQKRIVEEITIEINNQEQIKQQIASKRNEIDTIIEDCLKHN